MIRIDSSQVQQLSRTLARVAKDYKQARQRVLSTTRARTATMVKREIGKVYTLPQRRIAQGLTITNVDPVKLSFTIQGSKRVISATNFKHRENRRAGVTVQYIRGAGFKPARNRRGEGRAFKARARGFGGGDSSVQIFQRTSYKRLPLIAIKGPSVADMLSKSVVYDEVYKFATARIASELQRQIAVALNG